METKLKNLDKLLVKEIHDNTTVDCFVCVFKKIGNIECILRGLRKGNEGRGIKRDQQEIEPNRCKSDTEKTKHK